MDTSGCQVVDFSSQNYAGVRVGKQEHIIKSSTCTKGSRVRPTRQSYSGADPGLVCPVAAAAAAAAVVVAAVVAAATTSTAAADDFLFLKNSEPKRHGYIRPRTYVDVRSSWFSITRIRPAWCIADMTAAGTEVAPHYHQLLCSSRR